MIYDFIDIPRWILHTRIPPQWNKSAAIEICFDIELATQPRNHSFLGAVLQAYLQYRPLILKYIWKRFRIIYHAAHASNHQKHDVINIL